MKTNTYILPFLLLTAFLASLSLGSVSIPVADVLRVMVGQEIDNLAWHTIIIDYRLPKSVSALLAGSALGLSGLYMQTFFRNPLAGPYILGISAGASLGVAVFILGTSFLAVLGVYFELHVSLVFAAILGSVLVFLVVMFFSSIVSDNTSLLLVGLMFSSATAALVSILQYFSNSDNIQSFVLWSFGDLGGVSIQDLTIMIPILLVGFFLSVFLIKPLNILLLGDEYAINSGLNIIRSKYLIITLTAVLSGTVTAYCGPIAFVGLAGPHIARMLFNTSDHKVLVPTTALIGASILLICDIIARLPGLSQSLPLNAITSLFGGPLVIWLIVKRKNLQSSF